MHTSGKRQYLHKMQMLEMNRKRQEVNMNREKKSVIFTKFTWHGDIVTALAREYG